MAVQKLKMPVAVNKKSDLELKRLQKALLANEKLMQEAAIKYEDLVAVKEDLHAAIKARKEARAKNGDGNNAFNRDAPKQSRTPGPRSPKSQ